MSRPMRRVSPVPRRRPRRATSSSSGSATDESSVAAADIAAVVTDTSYTSQDTGITISTVVTGSGDSTVTYYVADVVRQ